MSDDSELDYAYLAQNALRGLVRDVLDITVTLGHPPGDHHFYVEFLTHGAGVEVSEDLRKQYPDRMTIVLQHQFENLQVHPESFEVTLHFKGVPNHLVIPYSALTQFADPSVNFALKFPTADEMPEGMVQSHAPESADVESFKEHQQEADHTTNTDDDNPEDDPPPGGSADVVSLDRFRKK
ncbi:MAG: ClpXP protease specificity-enhancing factor SspB [Pseudomonadota bacterium]